VLHGTGEKNPGPLGLGELDGVIRWAGSQITTWVQMLGVSSWQTC